MILLIDNYDSFSYNLYQLIGSEYDKKWGLPQILSDAIRVVRNDKITIDEIRALAPTHIVLSPGPGRPQDAGICDEVIRQLGGEIPILGVCLGHQAICEALGGVVGYAKEMMHGKVSMVTAKGESKLLKGFTKPFQVARYHSLAAEAESLPKELLVTAETEDGEVMAVEHKEKAIFGLQFHPESIMTPEGAKMIANFLSI